MTTATQEEPVVLDQFRQAKRNMKGQLQEEHQKTLSKISEIDQWFEKTNEDLKKIGLDFVGILKINLKIPDNPEPTTSSGKSKKKSTKQPEKKERVFTAEEQKVIELAKTAEKGFTYKNLIEFTGAKEEKDSNLITQALVKLMLDGILKEIAGVNGAERTFALVA